MKKESIQDLFDFLPKSKIKAGDGLESGIYPFYTSSENQSKYLNDYQNGPGCLVFGTGGKASVHFTKSKFSTSTDCISIQPKNPQELFGEYAFQYLKGNMRILEAGFKGAGLKHISKKYLSEIKIPLPPLDDQKRIAHLLGKVEGMLAQRKKHLQQLDMLLKSVFLEMFGDPVRNEKGWEKKKIHEICKSPKDIKCGPFGTQLNKSEFTNVGIPVWGIPQINSVFKVPPNDFVSIKKAKQLEEYSVIENDIVMSRKGAVGKCSVYPKHLPSGIMHSDVLRIRADWSKTNPAYLSFQLKISRDVEKQIANVSHGAIMPGINVGKLKGLQIWTPPIDVQNQFAAIVEKVESLKSRYQSSLSNLENLYGALSQKAFKGELDLGRVPLPVEEEQKEISLRDQPLNTAIVSKDFIKAMEIFGKQINETLSIPAELISQHANEIRRINENINVVSKSFSRMIPDSLVQSLAQINRLTAEAIKPIKLNTGFIQQMNDVYNKMTKALESPFMKDLIQKASEILEPWSEEYICEKIKTEFESRHFTIQDVLDLTAILYEVPSPYDPYQVIRPINGKKNDVIGLKDLFERALSNNYKCHMRVEQVYEDIENKDFKQVLLKVIA